RKLLNGMNPYAADYLDTPMFFWPMINNPALYPLTYFPLMFLVSTPFVWAFDHLGIFWDQRYLYLPAYLATLAIVPFLVQGTAARLAMTTAIALNPQLFPFVLEGRNDFFVLLFLFAGVALLMRERRTAASLAFAAAGAAKLHALIVLPFVAMYLVATRKPRTLREPVAALAGSAFTLLAFLFFGRDFQRSYLGFIVAVFTPVPFLTLRQPRVRRVRGLGRARGSLRPGLSPFLAPDGRAGSPPAALPEAPSAPPLPLSPAPVPVALDAVTEPSPVGAGSAD